MKKAISVLLVLALIITSLTVPTTAKASVLGDEYPEVSELTPSSTIPDPFKFFNDANDPGTDANHDGIVSNVAEWEARRNEIKELVQHYWLGYRWQTKSEDVSGAYHADDIPNTDTWGGFWGIGGAVINRGEAFNRLLAAIMADGITVEGTTYGPELDEDAAKVLAVEAWNAGYSEEYPGGVADFWGMQFPYDGGFAKFVEKTGPITIETIPGIYTGEKNYYTTITITSDDGDNAGTTASFKASISKPTDAQKIAAWGSADVQVPFVIDVGGAGAFSADNLNKQGYALVTFNATDIYPDDSSASDGISRNGVYTTLYPYDKDDYKHASGALMAWGWAVSQIITAVENNATGEEQTLGEMMGLDPARTVVTGHSRYGKVAMFAAAFDDRISICSPSEPGGSGIQSNRYKVEGKIFNFNTYKKADRVYGKTEVPTVSYGGGNSWFPETAAAFVGKDEYFPFDSDEIIALVAPRPFFVVSGIDSHWLGNEGGVASVQAAAEVYNYIGANEIEKNNIAIRCRESDHIFYPRDFCFALAIMDREFKQNESDTKLHVQDLFPNGTGISGMSYPAADYDKLSDINSYPFEINSSYMPWSSANKYMLWTAQENFLVAHDTVITAHSDAEDVDLYLPGGAKKIDAASHEGEVFTFNVSAEDAIYGRYELRTVGSAKENRSVFFAAVSLSDALRHGTTKGDEGEENRVLGFSSRLENTPSDAPLVYVGGSTTPEKMSFTGERVVENETTGLMEYGVWFHDNLFVRIANEGWDLTKTFNIKNLKFVTIPGFTFEFSMSDIAASAEENGKKDAAKFTKAISWAVEKYNNGPAAVWPELPDTVDERQAIEAGETIVRPEAPAKTPTNFDTQITDVRAKLNGENTDIIIGFDEPLNKGEYGFGLDVADTWNTTWNAEGTEVRLSVKSTDIAANVEDANLIIFRLMDTEGNLIGGPIEKTVDLTFVDIELEHEGSISNVSEGMSGKVDTIKVINNGTITADNIDIELSGTNADAFSIDKTSIANLASRASENVTVSLESGLKTGLYTAQLTVSGASFETVAIDISVKVNSPVVIVPAIPTEPTVTPEPETPKTEETLPGENPSEEKPSQEEKPLQEETAVLDVKKTVNAEKNAVIKDSIKELMSNDEELDAIAAVTEAKSESDEPASLSIKVNKIENVAVGDTVYVYRYNPETGKYEELVNGTCTVEKGKKVNLEVTDDGVYVVTNKQLDASAVSTVKKQIADGIAVAGKNKATLNTSNKAKCKIKVDLPENITSVVNEDELAITYKSYNKGIATVTKNGNIKAKAAGTVKVKVTVKLNGVVISTKTIKVTVK